MTRERACGVRWLACGVAACVAALVGAQSVWAQSPGRGQPAGQKAAGETRPAAGGSPASDTRPGEPKAGERERRSIVLLRTGTPVLDRAKVEAALSRALGSRAAKVVTVSGKEDGSLPPEPGRVYHLMIDGAMYQIIEGSRAYTGAAEGMRVERADAGIDAAIKAHTAWIALDFVLHNGANASERERVLGALAAELIDARTTALFDPASRRAVRLDAKHAEILRGVAPRSVFGDEAPPVTVRSEDEAIRAAEQEAQRRLPEFIDALKRREDRSRYLVKAAFTDGTHTEVMWVSVHRATGDGFVGELINTPRKLASPKEGDEVRVKREDVRDWMYGRDAKRSVGGFVEKVLQERKKGT